MKNIVYIYTLLMGCFMLSCSPEVELREQPSQLPSLSYSIDATDPNQPILSIDDPSVFNANWYFEDGTMLQGKSVQCFYPLEGNYKFTMTAANGLGMANGEGEVTVAESNPGMVYGIPEYIALCGKEGEGGKYWVWDQDAPGGNVSYMTADYNWEEFWWNPYAGDAGATLSDLLNEIKFDLEGGFNFTRFESKGVELEKGSFSLNIDEMTIQINNASIPNQYDGNLDENVAATGKYHIKVISDYELLLWQDQGPNGGGSNDYGWAWKFKARDLVPTDDPVYKLCFDGNGAPKQWKFDLEASSGGSYMTDPGNYDVFWWNPYAGDASTLQDYDNTIQFHKDGTYQRFASDGSEIEAGSYTYDRSVDAITFEGATIPNYNEPNLDPDVAATQIYEVKVVDTDELLLWQDGSALNPNDYDYGWAWKFVPSE
ncbi:PKD domain-containing protein [Flammeovirga aprica]|uniref:PKD domain-containing protein n=1 Tax=Flammeovirga aprica JL-4 TaxID=694437 RepID=A0A7X9XAX8_9BACT|nr:PKD domain-containing protein [Flammeovirga aprica]NME70063.1 hypothetical protein [Flammeovirga aprica JL-4]